MKYLDLTHRITLCVLFTRGTKTVDNTPSISQKKVNASYLEETKTSSSQIPSNSSFTNVLSKHTLRFNGSQNINHIRHDVNSRLQHICSVWGTAVLRPTMSLMYQPLLTGKLENQCTDKWQGMGKEVTAQKPAPLPLSQPQICHEQPRDSTRISAVRSRRVNT